MCCFFEMMNLLCGWAYWRLTEVSDFHPTPVLPHVMRPCMIGLHPSTLSPLGPAPPPPLAAQKRLALVADITWTPLCPSVTRASFQIPLLCVWRLVSMVLTLPPLTACSVVVEMCRCI